MSNATRIGCRALAVVVTIVSYFLFDNIFVAFTFILIGFFIPVSLLPISLLLQKLSRPILAGFRNLAFLFIYFALLVPYGLITSAIKNLNSRSKFHLERKQKKPDIDEDFFDTYY